MSNYKWYDVFLLAMIAVSAVVVTVNWDKYSMCMHPLRLWILTDFGAIFAFRILMLIDDGLASGLGPHINNSQMMMRFKGRVAVLVCMALILYPFLWAWTVIGSVWSTSANTCGSEGQKWEFLVWLLLSYCGLICIASLSIGKWLIRRQAHLQQAPQGSGVSEWQVLVDLIRTPLGIVEGGEPGQDMPGITLETATYHPGLFLTHSQREAVEGLIQQLPKFRLKTVPTDCSECPICLEEFHAGNEVRGLPCAHNFHVPCIDEWLRLNIKCPRCRCSVFPNLDLSALSNTNSQRSRGVASIYFGGDAATRASASSQINTPNARYIRAPARESNLLRLQEILRTMRIENASYNEIDTGQVVESFVPDGRGRPGGADTTALSGTNQGSSFALSETVMVERSPPARF